MIELLGFESKPVGVLNFYTSDERPQLVEVTRGEDERPNRAEAERAGQRGARTSVPSERSEDERSKDERQVVILCIGIPRVAVIRSFYSVKYHCQ
ncbi:hypothetical protein LR48_Vigan02g062500 [Vigna angularis]|uniref:Uncharacterized protein n=1 Tax=Phaseolus angularis TaxID=3914 RepID=A0A0L9TVA9_PHAAN|nr:hypothetical protein LR48_Vigan02g062500 [Vigna angularis]